MCCFLAAAAAEKPSSLEATPGRLPKNILPMNYSIRLKQDANTLTTEGEVTVDLKVIQPTQTIIFNSLDL
jgi:puromycin-sensitive aminopeptidase